MQQPERIYVRPSDIGAVNGAPSPEDVKRLDFIDKIIRLFFIMNGVTITVLVVLLGIDIAYIENQAVERVITGNVVIALISATVVQVGAIALGASKFLFRDQNPGDRS